MTNVNSVADVSTAEGGVKNEHPPPAASSGPALHAGSKVYKSGPLFLSSKGIGWTSWKKRWFVLTQTSLVFYRSDPNVVPQKGSEVNLTLGGIDLNSSGSVVVKEDKKLITVLFTDGRDGRTFTLKAETLEDLHDWKFALEEALSNAPNAPHVVGQNGVFRNDQSNATDATSEQSKDRMAVKSLVTGRPILLALEDIDGTPSFLEKALRFVEESGVKTEGILRQAADVEDVKCRIQEYEKGKNEFSTEDPHIIADCIKYVLRELPSPPVPASCCKALLEAYRTDRSMRVNAMRTAICETFPEPNRRLLQRILTMMQAVASQKAVNRMSVSAVAACMAPLLLRPLLAGDCDIENDFDVGGDGSVQLLQAAAAANHAQAIVITLLEEYNSIFGDGAMTHEPYTDSEESGSESEEITDGDDSYDEEEEEDDDIDDDDDVEDDEEEVSEDSQSDVDENAQHESGSASSIIVEDHSKEKISVAPIPGSETSEVDRVLEANQNLSSKKPDASLIQHDANQGNGNILNPDEVKPKAEDISESMEADNGEASLTELSWESRQRPARNIRRATALGRTPAKKNLSMESVELPLENVMEIQNVELAEKDLEPKISNEKAIAKVILQDTIKMRKHDSSERRVALEKDVTRLQVQLQKEMNLRTALEASSKNLKLPLSFSSLVDDKMKADLEEIIRAEADIQNLKKQADDLDCQLREQREQNSRIGQYLHQDAIDNQSKMNDKKVDDKATVITSTPEKSTGVKPADASVQYSRSTDIPKSTNAPQNPKSASAPQTTKAKDVHNSKNTGVSAADINVNKPGATTTRKASSRNEGSSSTTSALSKLTNRLNFLKERTSQITTELQSMEKVRHPTQHAPVSAPGKGSDHHQSLEKLDRHQEPKPEKILKRERDESHRNPGSHPPHNTNKGETESGNQSHEWGRSESYSTMDKDHPSKFTPRTFSG